MQDKKQDIDQVMENAWKAFHIYRKFSVARRVEFLYAIAEEINLLGDELLELAAAETFLPLARLKVERARTIFQLQSYGDAMAKGDCLDLSIQRANKKKTPASPDIRKGYLPLGPVVVFGAANFPFAYSTAGGDTASALAAGCPVIVKAHPAHAKTSDMVATAIMKAAARLYMPEGVFTLVEDEGHETGKALVEHPRTKAVGFTGSFTGGKQLFDWAQQRKSPIPVFAEMSSINPVFIMPEKLQQDTDQVAELLAGSITLGVGQFCTNPGIIVAIEHPDLDKFLEKLSVLITGTAPAHMLNTGIFKNYVERRANALAQSEVETIAVAEQSPQLNEGVATIASTSAKHFIENPILHQEVFGPFSLVVKCKSIDEMVTVAEHFEGQLTASILATETDLTHSGRLLAELELICGRLILNGVPTGVEVALPMHHGGPFPSTTDSRFTSVGGDAIRRFLRPICYQNWNEEWLPDALKDKNPLKLWRRVDGKMTSK